MMRRIGIACLVAVLLVIAARPLVAPYDPMTTDAARAVSPPERTHPLGTDTIGRDVMARIAAGAWNSVYVALVAIALSSLIGAGAGCLAGMSGGWIDRAISAVVDLLLAFPKFVILLNLAAVVPFGSSSSLGLVIGATSWMGTSRLTRTEVLSIRERIYVEAARAAGSGRGRILLRHVVPQVSRLVWESAGLRFASAILLATSLDYLGLGLPADRPTWGRMIRDGQSYLRDAPWIALPAVAMLCLTSVGFVLAGSPVATRPASPSAVVPGRGPRPCSPPP